MFFWRSPPLYGEILSQHSGVGRSSAPHQLLARILHFTFDSQEQLQCRGVEDLVANSSIDQSSTGIFQVEIFGYLLLKTNT